MGQDGTLRTDGVESPPSGERGPARPTGDAHGRSSIAAPTAVSGQRRLRAVSRAGDVVLFDFMTAVILFMLGLGLAFGVYSTVVESQSVSSRANDLTGARAADRLADDLLTGGPESDQLNLTCTDAFFDQETTTRDAQRCGFEAFDDSSTSAYLHSALGLAPQYDLRITLGPPSSPLYAMGSTRPVKGDVSLSYRVVTFEGSVGSRAFYVLRIWVWEAG